MTEENDKYDYLRLNRCMDLDNLMEKIKRNIEHDVPTDKIRRHVFKWAKERGEIFTYIPNAEQRIIAMADIWIDLLQGKRYKETGLEPIEQLKLFY